MGAVQFKEPREWIAGKLHANKARAEEEVWFTDGGSHCVQGQRKGGLAAVKLMDGMGPKYFAVQLWESASSVCRRSIS